MPTPASRRSTAAAARAMPGVHAVFTADDMPPRIATGQIPMLVPNPAIRTPRTQIALARDEVCYVGQTVAVVVADSRYARRGRRRRGRDRLRAAAGGERRPRRGEARRGARARRSRLQRRGLRADELRRRRGRVQERAACVRGGDASASRRGDDARRPRRAGELRCRPPTCSTVWSSTQTPHLCRGTLADLFERNLESIRVIAPLVGGGFGTKAPFYPEEAVIPAAAMKLGRPVKWQEDRREHFLVGDAGARPVLEGRHRGRRRRQNPRPARHHAARHRRLSAVGHHRAVHRGDDVSRALCGAGLQDREHGRADQPRADHGGARRRPAAGGVRDGAADGPRRART